MKFNRSKAHACLAFALAAAACQAGLAAPAAQNQAGPETLKGQLNLGDPAPALKVSRWVKGGPVTEFKKGKCYVIEMWATWCGPCKMAMPHLSKLAKKYEGKVTFIGVNVMERGKDPVAIDKAVDSFVAGMGDNMGYLVARDTPDSFMITQWYKPSKADGIPMSFLVDGNGRVAWMGHPMALEKVIEGVLAGGFDGKAYSEKLKKEETAQLAIYQALDGGNWKEAMEQLDGYSPMSEDAVKFKQLWCLRAQLHLDEKKAEPIYRGLASEGGDFPMYLARTIANENGLSKVWYERAVKILEPVVGNNPDCLRDLAQAQFCLGDKALAIKTLTAYVNILKGDGTHSKEPKMRAKLSEALMQLDSFK